MTRQPGEIHREEADFHDEWARAIPLEKIQVREAFESPVAVENRFIVEKMGLLKGMRILDIGAGLGESSTWFALAGAEVTATDISPAMVDSAVRLAAFHGVKVTGVVSPAERLEVPGDSFDLVYCANTIHHVTDKKALFFQMHRALRPGGRFFAYDPLAYNPVINIYRRMASEVRTPSEMPLRFEDVELAGEYFKDVGHREFWIAGLMLFVKYYAMDRVHPNAERYWKRMLRQSAGSLWWWKPLNVMDRLLTRVPGVRRLAWNMVMWGRKEN